MTHIIHQEHRRDKQDVLDRDEQNIGNFGKVVEKAHRISGRTFVIIPDVMVYKLGINEDTRFEEEIIDNGIFLRLYKF